jgi:hypothetical protein
VAAVINPGDLLRTLRDPTGPRKASADAIGQALLGNGYLRGSRFGWEGVAGHKEWLHFAVHGEGLDLLANFSLVDDVRHGVAPGTQQARTVCLVRENGAWSGDIDQHAANEVTARNGGLSMCLGPNRAVFRDGKFELDVKMRHSPIAMQLELRPQTFPSQANNLMVDDCPPIQWLVTPRWSAHGWVQIGAQRHELNNAVAYHDHNWGSFRWGKNFAWEWGYATPDSGVNPWTMVFVRLSDRAHLTDLMQAVFLWKGPRQHRLFRASELEVWHEGLLRPTQVFKLPRVMALAHPGEITDVPKKLQVRARRGKDHVDITFTTRDVAQVIIPNDDDLGVTIIHEVAGDVCVDGKIDGEHLNITGPSIFEFLGD